MKKSLILFLVFCLLCGLLCACGRQPDAEVLFREALSNTRQLKSVETVFISDLEYTAANMDGRFYRKTENTYLSDPTRFKSRQTLSFGGDEQHYTSYTMPEGDRTWYYMEGENGWQKTEAAGMEASPEILNILEEAKSRKFVREETLDGTRVYKLELEFSGERMRGDIQNIVTASGMGAGSKTIVDALLESAPSIYGYCYIDKESGNLLRAEIDSAGALNQVFGNIAGGDTEVSVSKCMVTASLQKQNAAAPFTLPPEAAQAPAVEAAG